MLPLEEMTPGDALHTLRVHAWITEHLEEIRAHAQTPCAYEVSASEIQEQFHRKYTELESTRFLPVKLSLFTDEETLDSGGMREPNVLIYQPMDKGTYVVADYFHTTDLGVVAQSFGIDAQERTWRLSHS
jgi:hypothetical protein